MKNNLLKNKTIAVLLFSFFGFASINAIAEEEEEAESDWVINGAVSLASEYNFRGLTLSARQPALQHSIIASHTGGSYFGYWASNTTLAKRDRTVTNPPFNDTDNLEDDEETQQTLEVDFFAGLYYDVTDDFFIDISGVYYAYNIVGGGDANSSLNKNYMEYFVLLGFLGGDVSITIAYSPEYFGEKDNGESTYIQFAYDGEVADNFVIRASAGLTQVDESLSTTNITAVVDYKLAFVATWNDGGDEAEFAFISVDANGKSFYADADYHEFPEWAYEDRLMFTLTKGF